MAPPSTNRRSISGVCEQKPETEDRLGEDVQDGISDDLSVNIPLACTVSNAPNNGVQSPENEGEGTNGSKERRGGAVLALDCGTASDGELVDNYEVCNAGEGIVSPLCAVGVAEGSEETEEDHEDVCYDGNDDTSSIQTSQESEVEEKERGGDAPVDISGPVHLAVDVLDGVGNILVCVLDNDLGV